MAIYGIFIKATNTIVWEAFWTVIRLRSPMLKMLKIIKHLKFFFKDYSEFVR